MATVSASFLDRLESHLHGPGPQKAVLAVLLLLLCCTLFFYRLGERDLWAPDEPRYAQVAREMIARSEWIVPYLNDEIYTQKPMMYFWLAAMASLPFGDVTPLAARLPSALAATSTVLLLFIWGSRHLGTGRAWIAAAVLATAAQFTWVARFGQMDLVFSAFVFLALVGAFEALEGRQSRIFPVLFYAAMAAGTLTKGPVAVLLCWIGPLVWVAARRQWRTLGRLRPFPGMLAVAAAVGAWYVPAVLSTQGAYGGWEILWKQTYSRAVHGYSHPKWFGYYFYDFPAIFLPWTLWLPAVWALKYRTTRSKSEAFVGSAAAEQYLMGFFYAAFFFFSITTEKRGNYLLPLFPAAAVYISGGWNDWNRACIKGGLELYFRSVYLLLGLALLLLAAAAPLSAVLAPSDYRPPFQPAAFFAPALVLLGLAFLACQKRRLWRTGWVSVLLAATLITAFRAHVVDPTVNPHKSARFLCEPLAAERARGAKLIGYLQVPPQFLYYSKGPIRVLKSPEAVQEYMQTHPKVLCILEARHAEKLAGVLGDGAREIMRAKVGHRTMVVLGNYEPGAEPGEGSDSVGEQVQI